MPRNRIAPVLMLMILLATLLAACGQTTTTTSDTQTTAAAPTTAAVDEPAVGATEAATEAPTEEATEAATEAPTEEATEAATEEATTAATEEVTEVATEEATTTTNETATAGADETATAGAAAELPNVSSLNIGPVKIASQSPLSGPQSALGTGIRNAVELAVEQVAPKLGLEVELVALDDQATPDVGASNANQIAADEDIMCVAGHLNSGVALAALPTYKGANLLMVSPANTNVRITDEFGGTAYRVVGRDDVQAPVAAEYANQAGYNSVYILHDKTDYGLGVAEAFRTKAEELGMEIVGFEGTEEKSVFDSVLNPVLAVQPDAVLWGGIYSEGGPLLKQMREKGIQAAFLGTDGLDNSELARLAGDAVIGVEYTTVAGPPSEYPLAAQMATDYEAKFNAPAPAFAPQGYDAAGICMTAIALAAQEANGRPTREQVRDAMQNLGSYEGVTGPVTFDEKGDRVPATYFILKVTSADPAEFGNSEIAAKLELGPTGE